MLTIYPQYELPVTATTPASSLFVTPLPPSASPLPIRPVRKDNRPRTDRRYREPTSPDHYGNRNTRPRRVKQQTPRRQYPDKKQHLDKLFEIAGHSPKNDQLNKLFEIAGGKRPSRSSAPEKESFK